MVSLEFNRLIDYYQNAEEIHEPDDKSCLSSNNAFWRERKDREISQTLGCQKGHAHLPTTAGRMDGANPANIMGFINDFVPGNSKIGRIDIMKSFSFFEARREYPNYPEIL